MIGLLVITHGTLAQSLLDAAATIVGPLPAAAALGVERGLDSAELERRFETLLIQLDDDGAGVLVLTDMFGGTPANLAARHLPLRRMEILNGVNLPMLLKCASCRGDMEIEALADYLVGYGREAIVSTRSVLRRRE
ncbi:MAG: PTS system fructose subfamily IIA component [Desulfuromonas thiophila]|nr:PTS system fructose subfamily IIA component [Desulfuromonas thiophila]